MRILFLLLSVAEDESFILCVHFYRRIFVNRACKQLL